MADCDFPGDSPIPGWFQAPPKQDDRFRLFDARAAPLVGEAEARGEAPEDASLTPRAGPVRPDGALLT